MAEPADAGAPALDDATALPSAAPDAEPDRVVADDSTAPGAPVPADLAEPTADSGSSGAGAESPPSDPGAVVTSAVPEAGVPEAGVPEAGVPEAGVPEAGVEPAATTEPSAAGGDAEEQPVGNPV
jgi:hypothetical protein